MTRRARSNSSAFVGSAARRALSGHGADARRGRGSRRRRGFARLVAFVLAGVGQGPEEAVGDHVAHAGAETRVEAAWSRKARASPTAACRSAPVASSAARPADSVSPAPTKMASKRSNFSPVIAACGDGQDVVEELVGQRHAGHQHVAARRACGGHGDLARRGRPLAVPVGQQEIGTASGGCRPAPRSAAAPARGTRRGRPAARPPRPRTGSAGRRPAARRGSRRAISATALTPSVEPRKPTFQAAIGHVLEDAARLLGDHVCVDRRDGRRSRRCRASRCW